uniref:TOBE domain-containing protein n=1 Tax=Halorussus salinisoli TaxID=2558242 RepID=UPI0010C1600B
MLHFRETAREPNAGVVVETDAGQEATAVITSNSVDGLGIEEGDEVNAVVEATEVTIENEA